MYSQTNTQSINESVSVNLLNNTPTSFVWRNINYQITKIGLHHNYFEGKTLIHVFSCLSDTLFIELKFNTKNLLWNLTKIQEI